MQRSTTDEAGPQADTKEDVFDEDLLTPSGEDDGQAAGTSGRDDAAGSRLDAWRSNTREQNDERQGEDEVDDGEAADELDETDEGRADEDISSETTDDDPNPEQEQEAEEDGPLDLDIEDEELAPSDPFGKVPQEEWDKYDPAAQERVKAQRAEAKRLQQQVSELEGLREHAEYGREVLEFAEQHHIESLEPWLNLAAVSRTDPQKAGAMLAAAAKRLGYQEPKPQLPAALQAEVDAGNLDEARAFEMAAEMGISTTPAPIDEPDISPPADPARRREAEAKSALGEVMAEYRGKLTEKSFKFVHAKATAKLRAAVSAGEIGPDSWAFVYRQAVDAEISARKRKPKSLGKQTRSTTPAQSGPKPAKKPASRMEKWRRDTGRGRR